MPRLALSALLALAPLLAAEVRVWQGPLVLPTYMLEEPDPNPVFPTGRPHRGGRPIYPYPMLDGFTGIRGEKAWNAVFLENEYLKVTVLPEMGGKLYAIFDKTANRDALYTNHVVKYAHVAIRGAWTSGGIEWNFPDGHTITTVSPVDYVIRKEPDGAASVTVGDTERIQRMQWAVTVRLRPGWKVVETEVRLNNRRAVPGRYWYWATASAPARDDLRFVYPMREAWGHDWKLHTFPKDKDGVDLGTYREPQFALSLFARQSKRDFMGVYYEKDDHGVIHVADHRLVPGKKTWTWGYGPAGRAWIDKLTDSDGQYVEFQAGRFETQMEHEFLAPHQVDHFTHYWYPVDKLGGGFDTAGRYGALKATREGSKVRVAINVNTAFPGASLAVGSPDVVRSYRVDLAPDTPYTAVLDLPPEAVTGPLVVRLAAANRTELLRYRSDEPVDGNPNLAPAEPHRDPPRDPKTADEAFAGAVAADKSSRELDARARYELALKLDPKHEPARTALGLSYYRTGELDKAAGQLKAVETPEARYYLALVRRAQGDATGAAQQLAACLKEGWRPALVRYELGELALAANDVPKAVEHLAEAVRLAPEDVKAGAMLALALRAAGKLEDAEKHITAVLAAMPIDYLALSEAAEIFAARGKDAEARQAANELRRLLAREPDSVLELAFDYLNAGRLKDASAVLSRSKAPQAMIHYTLGYVSELLGDTARAQSEYALGASVDPGYTFPHRLEELAVLRAALKTNPNDGRAHYYLGNLLASKYRTAEAIAEWREATRLDPQNAVAWRNLGEQLVANGATREEGIAAYRRAIQADPRNYRIWVDLAQALGGDVKARLALFASAPEPVLKHAPVALAFASACAEAGRLEDAAKLLDTVRLTPAEGDDSPLRLFRKVHGGLADRHRKAGRHAEAAAEYLKMAEPPRHLSVGATAQAAARYHVLAARELERAGQQEKARALYVRVANENRPVLIETLKNDPSPLAKEILK